MTRYIETKVLLVIILGYLCAAIYEKKKRKSEFEKLKDEHEKRYRDRRYIKND